MSKRAAPYLLLLIGLLLAVGGFLLRDTKVTCAGEELRPGEPCVEYSDTSRTAYTFDEFSAKHERQTLVIMGSGLLLVGWGAVGAWRQGRKQDTGAWAAPAPVTAPSGTTAGSRISRSRTSR
ncbi:hypothetical protein QEZ54_26100 [Catellatospora sp. KI3]|uniref:hypothetical protein n=1 Tax=Catellatospora sp. KI3 TaxID=3041620 RepID=UPI00248316EE|nr:hypothetical protein [Catellatospora sp. KI3]MDI1464450.1 hypothetical protein [Catellatospora sp. KI3]